jgi:hypothetical protein
MATRLQHGGTGAIFRQLNIAFSLLSTAFIHLLGNVRFLVVSVCIMLEMASFRGLFHGRSKLSAPLKRTLRQLKIVDLAFGDTGTV